jgi:hypothetical protein
MPILTYYTDCVSRTRSPGEALEALHELSTKILPLSVLGAARIPLRTSDWRSTRLGRDVFLHSSVPEGWWQEYTDMARREYDPGVMMARSSLMA